MRKCRPSSFGPFLASGFWSSFFFFFFPLLGVGGIVPTTCFFYEGVQDTIFFLLVCFFFSTFLFQVLGLQKFLRCQVGREFL